MLDNYSFYLSRNNNLFNGDVLVICYQFTPEEQKKYNLTSSNVVVFVKHNKINIDDINEFDYINYIDIIKRNFSNSNIYLRIQSECFLGMYGDSHCDCEKQRIQAIELISKHNGIYIHVPQEAQGWGLLYKLNELELQLTGRMPNGKKVGVKTRDQAQTILNKSEYFNDIRDYSFIKGILSNLGLGKETFIMITESSKKIEAMKNIGLNIQKFSNFEYNVIDSNNLSEYLIKILNGSHSYTNDIVNEILTLVKEGNCNERSLSTFLDIIKHIKSNLPVSLTEKQKKEAIKIYDELICGEEKSYFIGKEGEHKVQNHFCCKVSSSIFKALKKVFHKNIFDRISLEKLYYFKHKINNEMIKFRTSEILKIRDDNVPFFEGQHHAEERVVDYDRNFTYQNDVPISRLKAYVENSNYDFIKQVEMTTIISEYDLDRMKIFIKRLPTLEYRVMDIFAKKDDIRGVLNKLLEADKEAVLNTVTNKKYEDENFTKYNLRFADLSGIIKEETEIFDLLKGE